MKKCNYSLVFAVCLLGTMGRVCNADEKQVKAPSSSNLTNAIETQKQLQAIEAKIHELRETIHHQAERKDKVVILAEKAKIEHKIRDLKKELKSKEEARGELIKKLDPVLAAKFHTIEAKIHKLHEHIKHEKERKKRVVLEKEKKEIGRKINQFEKELKQEEEKHKALKKELTAEKPAAIATKSATPADKPAIPAEKASVAPVTEKASVAPAEKPTVAPVTEKASASVDKTVVAGAPADSSKPVVAEAAVGSSKPAAIEPEKVYNLPAGFVKIPGKAKRLAIGLQDHKTEKETTFDDFGMIVLADGSLAKFVSENFDNPWESVALKDDNGAPVKVVQAAVGIDGTTFVVSADGKSLYGINWPGDAKVKVPNPALGFEAAYTKEEAHKKHGRRQHKGKHGNKQGHPGQANKKHSDKKHASANKKRNDKKHNDKKHSNVTKKHGSKKHEQSPDGKKHKKQHEKTAVKDAVSSDKKAEASDKKHEDKKQGQAHRGEKHKKTPAKPAVKDAVSSDKKAEVSEIKTAAQTAATPVTAAPVQPAAEHAASK